MGRCAVCRIVLGCRRSRSVRFRTPGRGRCHGDAQEIGRWPQPCQPARSRKAGPTGGQPGGACPGSHRAATAAAQCSNDGWPSCPALRPRPGDLRQQRLSGCQWRDPHNDAMRTDLVVGGRVAMAAAAFAVSIARIHLTARIEPPGQSDDSRVVSLAVDADAQIARRSELNLKSRGWAALCSRELTYAQT